MIKPRAIIFFLAFALLIQNTCPMGAAGKSTVVSICAGCALRHQMVVTASSGDILASDHSSSDHFPMFVFSVPKTIHTFELESIKSVRPLLANDYADAVPHELLRPPRA